MPHKSIQNKSLGPYDIPNNILEAIPNNFHDMMYPFFLQCQYQKEILASWKHSITILSQTPKKIYYVHILQTCSTRMHHHKLFTSTILTTFKETIKSYTTVRNDYFQCMTHLHKSKQSLPHLKLLNSQIMTYTLPM